MIMPTQIALVRSAAGREVDWLHCDGSIVGRPGSLVR